MGRREGREDDLIWNDMRRDAEMECRKVRAGGREGGKEKGSVSLLLLRNLSAHYQICLSSLPPSLRNPSWSPTCTPPS